ncbi:hypothetical protein [Bradyrhizobium sp. NAS96.2]|uniref:hypothetical protein n=1 Tax=Bradyrhizobium sp. NAS96.2 TaxID=1680160 RepID=UPI000AC755F8|nr:hypothetical protein [Bradyrhizobium sp. NAS96.2]
MSRTFDDLKDKADRAERLVRTGLDPLTAERLRAFAEDCRRQMAATERDERGAPHAA